MPRRPSRRAFLKTSGALSATSLLGAGIAGCSTLQSTPPPPYRGVPLTVDEQLQLSASQAVDAIRTGRLTAETYVRTLLDRAAALKDLDALISVDAEGAIAEARRIDAMRDAGRPMPRLAGLPIVVKDNINTANLPTTGGTPALQGVRPRHHAPSVQKLVDGGAIVMAKSNLHELAFGITSTNFAPFAGAVRNPYDRGRIPGGSSGGTAAAIAARIVPAGLGTDTGGSARIPAALCGIVGFRPSVGNGGEQRRYTDTGFVVPISHTRDTVGPMGRTVADVALLDASINFSAVPAPASLRGLRIGVPASFWAGLDRQLAAVMDAAKAKLAGAGVVFVDADLAGLAELNAKVSFQVALHEPIADIPAYLAATGVTGITLADIAAQVASPDVKNAFGAILADAFGKEYDTAMNEHRPKLQALYARYFESNKVDAMLFPTTPAPAIAIDPVAGSGKFSIDGGPEVDTFQTFIRNTDPGSNAGIPGLSMPAGMTAGGLPVGLEIDGPLGSDARLLAIGLAFEQVLGSVPAPKA
jgi:mandelamide amidase